MRWQHFSAVDIRPLKGYVEISGLNIIIILLFNIIELNCYDN